MNILNTIVMEKRLEIAAAKRAVPAESLREKGAAQKGARRGFRAALEGAARKPAVIAELKRRSPSRGVLREDFDAIAIARAYEKNGASALSVLTDEKFFDGRLAYLAAVRAAVRLPLLRKDFILDEYQIIESLAAGADAILLIAGILEKGELEALHASTAAAGLEALVEIHSEEDTAKIRGLRRPLVGINNRDLKTFEVDLKTTERLVPGLPEGACIVSESGVKTAADLSRLARCGVRAVLVGEGLIGRPDPGAALKELLS